jgi:steroid 5-alpha reductase family enzyme
MVILWGLRLGIFLFIRIRKQKFDKRFDGIRESFPKFLRFWVFQALAVWIILLPSLLFISDPSLSACFNCTDNIAWWAMAIWAIGLLTEAIADIQKYIFSQNPKNKDRFIQSGLWKYSRHPNYFGEILCWVGIYLYVFGWLSPLGRLAGIISPLFIACLLLFVTGLPPLEKFADEKWGKRKDYKEYKRKTSVLIPWIPRA